MKRHAFLVLAGGLLVALASGFMAAQDKPGRLAKPSAAPKDPKREADEEAIRKRSQEFSQALEKDDAKAVADFWTKEGEYIADDGTTIRGPAAIEEAYAKFLAKNPKHKVEVSIEAIRFISQDNAIEEGYAKVSKGKGGQPSSSRYSTLYVRENGQWLIALLREWPDEGITLRDMEWLIGTWTARTDGGEIRSTYEWDEAKKFIRCRFTIKTKENALAGTQLIGRDPSKAAATSFPPTTLRTESAQPLSLAVSRQIMYLLSGLGQGYSAAFGVTLVLIKSFGGSNGLTNSPFLC